MYVCMYLSLSIYIYISHNSNDNNNNTNSTNNARLQSRIREKPDTELRGFAVVQCKCSGL